VKALYDSGWHHPMGAYVAGALLLVALARRLPFLYGYLVVFLVEILADATVTGAWSPVPSGTRAYTAWSVLFIVLGDFRYFLLVERVTQPRRSWGAVLLFTVPLALLVPVTTGILTQLLPAMQNDRVLYVVYETALGAIVLGLDRTRLARADVAPEIVAFAHRVSLLFAGLYFGWAACDVLLLLGVDAAHALRIVPNLAYYAVFLPFVLWAAPPSLRAWSGNGEGGPGAMEPRGSR